MKHLTEERPDNQVFDSDINDFLQQAADMLMVPRQKLALLMGRPWSQSKLNQSLNVLLDALSEQTGIDPKLEEDGQN